jgi:hypothetical protein
MRVSLVQNTRAHCQAQANAESALTERVTLFLLAIVREALNTCMLDAWKFGLNHDLELNTLSSANYADLSLKLPFVSLHSELFFVKSCGKSLETKQIA